MLFPCQPNQLPELIILKCFDLNMVENEYAPADKLIAFAAGESYE
jgi:hypothetical protein